MMVGLLAPSQLQREFFAYKETLKQLYKSDGWAEVKRILETSSDKLLLTLINILFRISKGDIPLPKSRFEEFRRSKKAGRLKKLIGSKGQAREILSSSRENQTRILMKFASSFNILLYSLFTTPPELRVRNV